MQPGLVPGARLSKAEVNYRLHEKCLTCDHRSSAGSCDTVEGNISPDAVCNKYAIRPPESPYRDKEFYQSQFDKANK